jgi:uncharacterized protein YhaN
MKTLTRLFMAATLAVPFLALADDGTKANADLRKEMLDLSKSVSAYSGALGDSMNSLESLRNSDPKKVSKAFASFRKNSEKLEATRKAAESQIDGMSQKQARYFSQWDKDLATISNPELKKASLDRRQKVMTEHGKLTADAKSLRAQVAAFMTKQQELRKFLGTDTTASAVTAAKGPIDEVLRSGRVLVPSVDDTAQRLKAFGMGRE